MNQFYHYLSLSLTLVPSPSQFLSRPQSAQAAQKESSRFSPLLLSPLLTPPQFKLSPEGPEPEEKVAIKPFHVDDSIPPPNATTCSSPELTTPELTSTATKTPHPDNVLRTRTNLQETVKEAGPVTKVATPKEKPSVGMVIMQFIFPPSF